MSKSRTRSASKLIADAEKTPPNAPNRSSPPAITLFIGKRRNYMDSSIDEFNSKKIKDSPAVPYTLSRVDGNFRNKSKSTMPAKVYDPTAKPGKSILRNSRHSIAVERPTIIPNNMGRINVSDWTMNDVINHFTMINFNKQDVAKFKTHEIDGKVILKMKREDLNVLNLKLGPKIKIWDEIERLQHL